MILDEEVAQSQKYRLRAFLVPKLGNHATTSDLAVEFINVNNLSADELQNYEQAVAFIKGVENPFRLKPSRVVELVAKSIDGFNMTLHTKCWKHYDARPRDLDKSFKGEYAAFMEGFDGYLYSLKWVKFLKSELTVQAKLNLVKAQTVSSTI